ncbi:WD40 repeat-like protein [Dichomitus squalens]|uniref:WD40 repeat-like protein n=1 Tax=Dichomitus squalens TaxID=114155 RepID=A0A4Q9PDN1_9APHY|nr:WD40 repeat-like protein [Dichomitus squalens]
MFSIDDPAESQHPSPLLSSITQSAPALPWEVIETAIDLCSGDNATLCALALTCSQLHPRSLLVLFTNVDIHSQKQLKQLYDAVQAKPHLQPVVKSLSFSWDDVSPFPLLSILPGLRDVTFKRISSVIRDDSQLPLLTIRDASFQTETIFLRFLSAFPNIENFTCERLSSQSHTPLGDLHLPCRPKLRALNNALLTYPAHRALLTVPGGPVLNVRSTISWSDEIRRLFRPFGEKWAMAEDVRSSCKPGHDSGITALVISSDGRWVATASEDSIIILWDARETCISQEWFAHNGEVWDLAFSPDGRRLASAGDDGTVAIWDISGSSRQVATLEGHPASVIDCTWSSDGRYIASQDTDSLVRLWDGQTFQPLPLDGANKTTYVKPLFSPDSQWLLFHERRGCGVWNVVSRTYLALRLQLEGKNKYPITAAFNPSSTNVAVGYDNGIIRVWDLANSGEPLLLQAYEPLWVRDVAFSPGGQLLLSASDDKTIKVWDARTGGLVQSLEGHEDQVRTACFSPCGKYIASASDDSTVRVWRTSDGSCLATLSDHGSWVEYVAFTPDGTMLWSAVHNGTVLGRRLKDIIPDDTRIVD